MSVAHPSQRLAGIVCAALAGVLATTALAGCSDSLGAKGGPNRGDSRYVAGKRTHDVIATPDRKPAPDFGGTTIDGKHLRIAGAHDHVVVVNFWASWCAPCRSEAPTLESLARKDAPAGVEFVGVNIKDGKTNAQAYARRFGLSYPSLYDQAGSVALDFRKTVPPQAIPSTIVIDRHGRIAGRIIGPAMYSTLNQMIDSIRAQRS